MNLTEGPVRAVAFDFVGVVASVRMAVIGDVGDGAYVIEMNQDVLQAIRRLRGAGIKTALITNNDRQQLQSGVTDLSLAELFDVDTFSSDVDAAKPGRHIFEYTLERLGTRPEETLFLDDLARNVDGALRIGMQALVVESPEDVLRAVDQVLAELEPAQQAS